MTDRVQEALRDAAAANRTAWRTSAAADQHAAFRATAEALDALASEREEQSNSMLLPTQRSD